MAGLARGDLAVLLGRIGVADRSLDDLQRRTDGNPFYVEELVAAGEPSGAVPPTLAGVILARVHGLPEPTPARSQAAVLGELIDHQRLAELTGQPLPIISEALREAVSHHTGRGRRGLPVPACAGAGSALRRPNPRRTREADPPWHGYCRTGRRASQRTCCRPSSPTMPTPQVTWRPPSGVGARRRGVRTGVCGGSRRHAVRTGAGPGGPGHQRRHRGRHDPIRAAAARLTRWRTVQFRHGRSPWRRRGWRRCRTMPARSSGSPCWSASRASTCSRCRDRPRRSLASVRWRWSPTGRRRRRKPSHSPDTEGI